MPSLARASLALLWPPAALALWRRDALATPTANGAGAATDARDATVPTASPESSDYKRLPGLYCVDSRFARKGAVYEDMLSSMYQRQSTWESCTSKCDEQRSCVAVGWWSTLSLCYNHFANTSACESVAASGAYAGWVNACQRTGIHDGSSAIIGAIAGSEGGDQPFACYEKVPADPARRLQTVVSGVGDPHLSNLRGERFDIYQPGIVPLLRLPRRAEPEGTLLLLEASAKRAGDVCSVYFQSVAISGRWTNQSEPIEFFANSHGAPMGMKWKEWKRFGTVELKMVRRTKGVEHVDVYAKLSGVAEYAVGGLLGSDDHKAMSTRPRQCSHRHAAALVSSIAAASP
jgi:hypothetical protein